MNIIERSTESQGCLPDDLFIMILLCLPADVLHNVMRYVCRNWNKIIRSPAFISTHLQMSKWGLIIKKNGLTGKRSYVLQQTSHHGCGVEVKEFKSFKHADNIKASCNGLVLVFGPKWPFNGWPSYVANLATKQHLPLPLIHYSTVEGGKFYLAYASASGVYKVIYAGCAFHILTVGVDMKWREVDMSGLTSNASKFFKYRLCDNSLSVSVNGFVYWVQRRTPDPFIICFDIETETFKQQIFLPSQSHISPPPRFHSIGLLAMEKSLCLYKRLDSYSFEFWLLKDQESGDGMWEKLLDIDLTESKLLRSREIAWITPSAWLNKEQLVLKAPDRVLVYNLSTGELHQIEQLNEEPDNLFAHLNSLVNLSMVMKNGRLCKSIRPREKVYSEKNMMAEFEDISGQLI